MYSSRDCMIKINLSCRVCSLLFASFMLVSHQPPVLPPVFLSRCQSFETALACASSRKFHSEQKPNISTRLTFDYLLAWDIKALSVFCYSQTSCGRPRVCLHIHLFSSPLILLGVFVKHVFTGSFLEIKRGLFALLSDCLVHPSMWFATFANLSHMQASSLLFLHCVHTQRLKLKKFCSLTSSM